jgi:hypothetical protein
LHIGSIQYALRIVVAGEKEDRGPEILQRIDQIDELRRILGEQ